MLQGNDGLFGRAGVPGASFEGLKRLRQTRKVRRSTRRR